jgi:putative phage-type endonuclease
MPRGAAVVIPVRQRTPEWLAARENGIGASDAPAAIGVSPWKSPLSLWAEKLGLIPAQPPTLPMMLGTELEPLIARLYTEATGTKVRRVNMLRQHPTHTFMLASLDRRAGTKPVELKYSARGTGYGDPGTDEVPDDVLVQVLHQLAVMDEDEADVAAVIGGRSDVQIYTIRRDAAAEAAIIEREAVLWDHVLSRTEPPLDASDSTASALVAMYPQDDGETIESTDEEIRAAFVQLREAAAAVAAGEAVEKAAKTVLKDAMGNASRLVVPGVGYATWKTPKDSVVVHHDLIAAGYRKRLEELGVAPADLDAVASIHTEIKPNTRRFLPKFDEE